MARPRYRPKLPDLLQAAEHDDAYAGRLASKEALGEVMDVAGVDLDVELPEEVRANASGSRVFMVVGAVVVAVVILAVGWLLDG